MLDKQYSLYSVDTGHFFSNREKDLHDKNCKYRRERNFVQNKLSETEGKLKQFGYTDDDIKNMEKSNPKEMNITKASHPTISEYLFWARLIKHKREKAKETKGQLLALLSNKVNQNELTNGTDHIRTIREASLNDTNIISVFDSALSRTIGIKQDELTDALIIVQVYYFEIFKDISF